MRLPPDIAKRLHDLAKITGRTQSFYAREAVIQHLGDLEDRYLARQRLDAVRAGTEKTIPLSDLMVEHGLED